jgi:hypothetical protein
MKNLAISILVALTVCSCSREKNDSYSVSDFLSDRNAVLNYLSDSFTQPLEGTEMTDLSAKAKPLDPRFPGDEHIRSVLKRQRWAGHKQYHFALDLSDAILSSTDQGSSNTMVATRILDHYFSGLSKCGFRNQGSPNVLVDDDIQYAGNVWYREGSNNISVFGTVYVDRNEKSALVVMNLSEIY